MPRTTGKRVPDEVSVPKTTRPPASERRDAPQTTAMSLAAAVLQNRTKTPLGIPVLLPTVSRAAAKAKKRAPRAAKPAKGGAHARTFDAMPDRIDIRDWPYQPTLQALPPELVSIGDVPAILDQGSEGACTGFGLAAVINYQLAKHGRARRVSPRMLYEMARKYDEWPGENYEGSSARGAMIGWVRHGVVPEEKWPANKHGAGNFTPELANLSRAIPGGAFYRVVHTQVRDVHAALLELGAIYMTIQVHDGWDTPGPEKVSVTYRKGGKAVKASLPVIKRKDRAPDGHAVALVGYTQDGFIIQNSWGTDWGYKGFALLPYEDFMIHATDVWAAQIGVPVSCDVWSKEDGSADTSAGMQRAADAVPLDTIRPYVIDCGDNGLLSDAGQYWTTEDDVERLFTEIIPDATKGWQKKRVALYLHGGLNSETAVAKRVVAFRDVFLANEIYPLHIMWESSAMESLSHLILNTLTGDDQRASGAADWLKKARDRLVEAKDRTFELTTARPGGAMWGDMKRDAMLSSEQSSGKGGMQLIEKHVLGALAGASAAIRNKWEFHIIAHSAGSIYFAYALQHLLNIKQAGIPFASVNFMAPAATMDLFRRLVVPQIQNGACPQPSMFILSRTGETDDTVGPYGKSLLWLVSNAFEGARGVPLLGMEEYLRLDSGVDSIFQNTITGGYPSLVIAGEHANVPYDSMTDAQRFSVSESESHGGFDNDKATMNSILRRILVTSGAKITQEFTDRDLQY